MFRLSFWVALLHWTATLALLVVAAFYRGELPYDGWALVSAKLYSFFVAMGASLVYDSDRFRGR